MSRMRTSAMCLGAALIIGAVVFLISRPAPDSVRYHLKRIQTLQNSMWIGPVRPRDYFRPGVWRWWLHHRPSVEQTFKEIDKHREALVKLGYFERRDFILTNRVLSGPSQSEFNSLLNNVTLTDRNWSWKTSDDHPGTVTVTAAKQDMVAWSNVLQQFDSKEAQTR